MQSVFPSNNFKMKINKHFLFLILVFMFIFLGFWLTSYLDSPNRITGSFAGFLQTDLVLSWLFVITFFVFVIVFNLKNK